MSIHDGVVTIDENEFHVILGVEDDKIRLSAGGQEIGEWQADECTIDPAGEGVFEITAEEETLRFAPNNPGAFAAAMNGGRTPIPEAVEPEPDTEDFAEPATASPAQNEAPAPKMVTVVVFYALAGVTAVLGLWALVSRIL